MQPDNLNALLDPHGIRVERVHRYINNEVWQVRVPGKRVVIFTGPRAKALADDHAERRARELAFTEAG